MATESILNKEPKKKKVKIIIKKKEKDCRTLEERTVEKQEITGEGGAVEGGGVILPGDGDKMLPRAFQTPTNLIQRHLKWIAHVRRAAWGFLGVHVCSYHRLSLGLPVWWGYIHAPKRAASSL